MKHIKAFLNHFRIATSSKLFVVSSFVVLSGVSIAANLLVNPSAVWADLPRDCDSNSIIYCGATTKDEFVEKYNENKTGDLKAIYEKFGLSSDELSRFKSTAKMATVYKDGRVVVDGKVVAHDAYSLGRHYREGSSKITIGGKTYYIRSTSVSFASDSIKGYIMFDGDAVEFIALTSCGNPVTAKQPQYSCDMLNSTKISDTTYEFSTNVTAKEKAKLTKVVYEFGDGKTETKTSASEVVTHTYDKPGNYTTKVTAYFEYFGQTLVHTSKECTKEIEIPKPIYKCSALNSKRISRTEYQFTVETEAKNGASLKSANFNFGDEQTAEGIETEDGETVTVSHEYSEAGNYKIVATVDFNIADGVESVQCETDITIDESPFYACKNLKANPISRTEYEFIVDTASGNGASLKSANFNFGDEQTAEGIETEDGNTVVAKHNYAEAGTYTTVATANFNIAEDVAGDQCTVEVTVEDEDTPETPEETPELPSTGPGAAIGGFFGSSALGLGIQNWIKSRRNLRDVYKK